VTGWAADEKGQCVSVEPTCAFDFEMQNAKPHVTVACAADTKPFYSNELLEKSHMRAIGGPVLSGWTGWWDGHAPRYDQFEPANMRELKGRI